MQKINQRMPKAAGCNSGPWTQVHHCGLAELTYTVDVQTAVATLGGPMSKLLGLERVPRLKADGLTEDAHTMGKGQVMGQYPRERISDTEARR